ncbi:MAG: hypothetical protein ACLQUY_19900 [Ktedonobacterales bacterium]
MRDISSAKEQSQRRYITDVYDEENHTFLVRYPVWLVVGLGLSGVLVFMLTGFLGFRDTLEPVLSRKIFHEPWPLYLWFSALILVLQISILRHRSLRSQLTATLAVTIFSVIFLGVLYFNPSWFDDFIKLLQHFLRLIFHQPIVLTSTWTYTIINFLIIGIFWIDTIRRWIRLSQGQSPTGRIDLATGEWTYAAGKQTLPTMAELVSGDLVAGAFLTIILAVVLRQEVISFFLHTIGVATLHPITTCTVSLPGMCTPPGGGINNPPTLTFVDVIQSLIYLTLGLLILALYATIQGLVVMTASTRQSPEASAPRLVAPRQAGAAQQPDIVIVSVAVMTAIVDTLRTALSRRINFGFAGLVGSIRTVVWPSLIFLGVVAVAASARYIQTYLHLQSDERTCTTARCPTYGPVQALLNEHVQITAPIGALIWGIIAVMAIVFSAVILIDRWRVGENTLRLLGLIGLTVLLTFWIFSLALSGFNALFSLTGISQRVPFPQPGVSTVISLVALLIFGTYSLARTVRSRRSAPPGLPVGTLSEKREAGTS